ncbi:GDSL lipase/esterase - like 10 [Theobroma cacao]|nr:GDSL lipase/esterase - like 10 [Theobroma cacao]
MVLRKGRTASCASGATIVRDSSGAGQVAVRLKQAVPVALHNGVHTSIKIENCCPAAEYAGLPLIPPYFQPVNNKFVDGVNFASAGAGALVETHQGFVINLNTQVSYFKDVEKLLRQELGDAEAKRLLGRALYIISIGSNDYFVRLTQNSSVLQSYSEEEYVAIVIGNLTVAIKEIHKKGGRKFGFLSLGPLGCIPGMKVLVSGSTGSCVDKATTLAHLHNKALSIALQKLENRLEGFKFANHDLYTSVSERMNNPSKYGFKVGNMACCGSGPYRGQSSCGGKRQIKEYQLCEKASEYLFFDSGHPTEMAHRQIAELIWHGTPNITRPYPTGRFSDGRLIPDFIAEYAGLPLIPAYLQPGDRKFIHGVNFASAGAGALVETNQGFVIDLKTQVSYFKKAEKSLRQELGVADAKKLLSRAVYLISIGANDYLTRNSTASDVEYVAMVIGNLTIALKEIYKIGGRKFGFPNMAPLGCLPFIKARVGSNGSCLDEVNKLAQLHDQELPKVLHELEKQLPGFKYSNYNFYKTVGERLSNPSKYGFKDATTACCGSGLFRGIYSCGGKRGIKEYELSRWMGVWSADFDRLSGGAELLWGGWE